MMAPKLPSFLPVGNNKILKARRFGAYLLNRKYESVKVNKYLAYISGKN